MYVQVYVTLWNGDRKTSFRFQGQHIDVWKEIRNIVKYNLYDYVEISIEKIDKITDLFMRRNDIICFDYGKSDAKKEC